MTAVNKSLIKVIKWKLWAFKPICRLTLHILLHKNIISSKIERLINPLSQFKIHEFWISNPLLKIVFETSIRQKPRVSYFTLITKKQKCIVLNIATDPWHLSYYHTSIFRAFTTASICISIYMPNIIYI